MMKNILPYIAFFLTFQLGAQSDIWTQKDTVNGSPRSVAAAFVAGGEGYTVCGLDYDGFRRKVYSYTDWQDDWDDEPSLGGDNGSGLSRGSATAFGIGKYGYVCLGQGATNPFFQDLWEFDTETNVWTQKADFIGSPRRQAVGFAIDEYAYVGTGISASGLCKDMFKYDPLTNTWAQLNDFGGSARKEAVGFAMGDEGYIGTGDDGVMRNDFWQYDPVTDNWTQKANFPGTARKGAVGFGIFPQAFIGTGEDITFTYTNDLWEYNYFADAWVQRADFPGAGRTNAFAFVLNNVAYVGTGYNGAYLDDFYAYYKATGTASLVENKADLKVFPNPVKDLTTISISDQNVLIDLYDMSGKCITSSVTIEMIGSAYLLDRQMVPAGTYILEVKTKNKQIIGKQSLSFI